MKRVLCSLCAFLACTTAACSKDGDKATVTQPVKAVGELAAATKAAATATAAAEPLRSHLEAPPPPPIPKNEAPPASAANVTPDEVLQGPTKGEASPEALARALVEAAKRRDPKAFLDLTVCGRDIGLHFHPGVQVGLRQTVGRLQRKFATYTQQIPADGELLTFKAGLRVDFQKGQGAITPMPGFLSSDFVVKAGATPRSLPLGRIVQIDGRWKLLDF